MTTFIRLLSDQDKHSNLQETVAAVRSKLPSEKAFEVDPISFKKVPGSPFAYWATENLRNLFLKLDQFEYKERLVRQGLSTADDFRFVRCWWEVPAKSIRPVEIQATQSVRYSGKWFPLLKGGGRSSFVSDLDLVVNYQQDGKELKAWISGYINGAWSKYIISTELYYQRGYSWALRSSSFSPSAVPDGCIFSASRYQAFTNKNDLPWTIALLNSGVVSYLLRMCSEWFERPKFVVGIVAKLPFPQPTETQKIRLSQLFSDACRLKLIRFSRDEVSHYFVSPISGGHLFDANAEDGRITAITNEIDEIAVSAYGLTLADVANIKKMLPTKGTDQIDTAGSDDEDDDSQEVSSADSDISLNSWAVGVAFGRFDWRMATGEREAPLEPDPFDPLPAKSPGMLPDGSEPFHTHTGILVEDRGHTDDLTCLVEEVLARVDMAVPNDVRRWLQRDFFAFHLQRYSKSRRKAPIYWPLSTQSGTYTLWVYYPSLTSQTLYIAINDFVEPKLKQIGDDVAALRNKGSARTRDDEKQFETLQAFELELIELRDTLLQLAPTYKPCHDDGVQISAAPLWPLFRHKPWQKILKDTWAKLETGDYDWAYLAMNYWPERVREKCKTDKSLAIAHGLEHLYVEPEAAPKKTRGRKKAGVGE